MSAALVLPQNGSTPSLEEFDPTIIPYQAQVINDVRAGFDYGLGVHELLLSGSVGSAKSILLAHLALTHVIENTRARFALCRRSMPDLKSTVFSKVLEHLEGTLIEGKHFKVNQTKAQIDFANGSEIISRSWADKKYKKFRSVELSGAGVEELTENDDEDKQAYDELKMRVGRLPHVRENFIVSATNPDAPSHWAHKYFIESTLPTRHVYYSVTTDNPFLPDWYIQQLLKDLDPKLAERMIRGKWIEINTEVVYRSYDRAQNYRATDYEIDTKLPIRISFDFNIGEGKPMSAVLCQYLPKEDQFHWFDQVVVNGARTEDIMEELAGRGLLDHKTEYRIHGDASGKHNDTRSKRSDYDIIEQYLANYRTEDGRPVNFEMQVPRSNPPVRQRHNRMNAYMRNALGHVRFFVYEKASKLDEGCRLVKLKPGGQYIEDDSKEYQHITTAAGYAIHAVEIFENSKPQRTLIL